MPLDSDEGATAIIVGILTVVLFGLSALAVEITDMFSRDRAVQTTADLAAFAGAQELPDTCVAFISALAWLNDPENGVRTADGDPGFAATATQMSDGDRANGEIEVLDANDTRIAGCSTTAGRAVRVVVPPRKVKFALAGVMPGAPDSGEVQAVAKVELRGLESSVMPMSLPSNCPSGSNYIYVRQNGGGPSEGDPEPDYEPNGHNNGPHVTDVDPDSPPHPGPATVVVGVNELREDPVVAANTVAFDFHLLTSDGTTVRAPSPGAAVFGVLVPGSVTSTGGPGPGSIRYTASYTVSLPSAVRTTSGSWKVRAVQDDGSGSPKWTDDDAVGTLTIGLPSSPGCPNPSTGDFGLLTSPRAGENRNNGDILNIIFGIDHELVPVANSDPNRPCLSDRNPYPDGILDDNDPAIGGESCVDVKPGETTSLPTKGLITGGAGEEGRLVVRSDSPDVSSSGDCRVAGDPDLQWRTNDEDIVNTVLSCYLSPGSTLNDVRNGVVDSLTAEIWEDPRFFYLPVTDTSDRPGNGFWPIKEFRGAFITNEDGGGDATCVSDNDCNGLTFNGGDNKIRTIQAFTFPLSALPEFVDQPGNGTAFIGGSKDLLLVE